MNSEQLKKVHCTEPRRYSAAAKSLVFLLKMPCIAYGRNAGISLGEPVQVVRRCSRSLSAALRWLRKLTYTRARWRWRQSIQALQPPGRLTLTTHHSSSCWRTPQHPCSQERREVTGSRDVGRGTIPRRMGSGTGSRSLVLCQTNSLVQCCFKRFTCMYCQVVKVAFVAMTDW